MSQNMRNLPRPYSGPISNRSHCKITFPKFLPILGFAAIIVLSLSFVTLHTQNIEEPSPSSEGDTSGPASPTRQQIIARANDGLEHVRDWSLRFGREIHQVSQEATCHRALRDQFDPAKSDPARRGHYRASVVSTDWTRAHKEIVETISTNMRWTLEAVEAIVKASESLASNHTHDDKLHVDYVDVHRLYDIDEIGPADEEDGGGAAGTYLSSAASLLEDQEPQQQDNLHEDTQSSGEGEGEHQQQRPGELEQLATPQPLVMQPAGTPMPNDSANEYRAPVQYLKLERHKNFGEVPISTERSAVHTPVHIYPGEPGVMNGIAWSEQLTRVFKNNFVYNPKLTNQYFASPLGFMRLFPAQKWQIPRADPDLYDARMRPWYVAGASSRKDVIVLIDASGSMTGSRRDIAKGVTFEILDTLTDNDHFLVLKFNDIVQQVGVPACPKMRLERSRQAKIPLKNTVFQANGHMSPSASSATSSTGSGQQSGSDDGGSDNASSNNNNNNNNGTDLDSLYLLPASGRNVRYAKTNFTLGTSGIANFSHALVTAFEVLRKYQDNERLGSQCNQAIMLITDGSPSDFEEIFNRYNYPNAPVRVFTYLIGRETSTSDGSHTKMMACHNRGYYTHVINLAEVRETVQQYIPVMARPLVLNRTHPTTWTPAYGELTYQMLTDWIWESKRRERARAIIASSSAAGGAAPSSVATGGGQYRPDIRVSSSGGDSGDLANGGDPTAPDGLEVAGDGAPLDEQELDAMDIFGYVANPDCFWETQQNDLLTTVVQPVYDQRNSSRLVENFLNKNVWTTKESIVRTANLLGVAAADMKINDIMALAPSHRLGPNGYAIMLTNNGLVMHHPDLRSILEPFSASLPDLAIAGTGTTSNGRRQESRILKPFFSSLDFVQVEHILHDNEKKSSSASNENTFDDERTFLALRDESVQGKTGWRELTTKRTLDCQRRVQTRRQSFYYKPLEVFPFSFLIAIPQPYGSHRVEAQVELKSAQLPEKLTTYFTTSDFDLWSVHPQYPYCDGPSNITVTTLLDVLQRLDEGKLNDVQWRPAQSAKPPLFSPDKIICDKQLVQSLVFDAVATFSFSDNCGPPSLNSESNLFSMFGVRFSFIATRSGLTRVRHYNADDPVIKKEALAFARRHARAIDETYYSRTVDYNMLINETATIIQVPFNTHLKIAERLARFRPEQRFNNWAGYGPNVDGLAPDGTPLDPSADGGGGGGEQASGGQDSRLELKDMNLFEKLELLANSSLHVIATQSLVVNEGTQRAVAGVTGVFYDYASFVMRLLNTTMIMNNEGSGSSPRAPFKKPASCYLASGAQDEACSDSAATGANRMKCGLANDTLDCLLVDNNGYILLSERLEFVGRNLRAYDSNLMGRLVALGVYHEVNITDYQSICVKASEESSGSSTGGGKQSAASSSVGQQLNLISSRMARELTGNLMASLAHLAGVLTTIGGFFVQLALGHHNHQQPLPPPLMAGQQNFQPISAQLPNKSYLRPCDRVLTRYETRPGQANSADTPQYFTTSGRCQCPAWFVFEQVPETNLIMLMVDHSAPPACLARCEQQQNRTPGHRDSQLSSLSSPLSQQEQTNSDDDSLLTQYNIIGTSEEQVCSMFERESSLFKRKLDSCISHHPDEDEIKLCGRASQTAHAISGALMILVLLATSLLGLRSLRARPWLAF